MKKAKIVYNQNFNIDIVEPGLFGSFVEHIGHCMYGGICEPSHESSDENGFRSDVRELIRELGITMIRYPGGNFVSGYHWKDGIGPKEKRPARRELAWGTIETNQVGIDEFIPWIQEMKIEPLMAVNLGTGTAQEAGELVEYSNIASGTFLSELRKQNGHAQPYDIKYFCLGNEMDGDWQICTHTPEEYARKLRETAKIVKWIDPDAKIIACGSCTNEIGHKTFGEWDKIVLDEAYDCIDYLSIHRYYNYHPEKQQVYEHGNTLEDVPYFFSNMENYIRTISAVCDFIKGKKHSDKTIPLSFDEWGLVTLSAADPGKYRQKYSYAEYTQYDAVIYGGMLCVLLNSCDRVKIACQSLLVNEGGMISTDPHGKAIRQTIFYPFMQTAHLAAGGICLQPSVQEMAKLQTAHYGEHDALRTACVWQPVNKEIILFAANLDRNDSVKLEVDFSSFGNLKPIKKIELFSENLADKNTFTNENVVLPQEYDLDAPENGIMNQILKPHSWNIFCFRV